MCRVEFAGKESNSVRNTNVAEVPLSRIAARNKFRFLTSFPSCANRIDPIAIAPADWPNTERIN